MLCHEQLRWLEEEGYSVWRVMSTVESPMMQKRFSKQMLDITLSILLDTEPNDVAKEYGISYAMVQKSMRMVIDEIIRYVDELNSGFYDDIKTDWLLTTVEMKALFGVKFVKLLRDNDLDSLNDVQHFCGEKPGGLMNLRNCGPVASLQICKICQQCFKQIDGACPFAERHQASYQLKIKMKGNV